MRQLGRTSAALLLLLALSARDARAAEAEPLRAALSCRHQASPGRVVCELESEVDEGELAWFDVLVVKTPDFARALRTRVGPAQATSKSERRVRIPLALVAARAGQGEVEVIARAVVCVGGRCRSVSQSASAKLSVGVIREER